MSKKKKKKTKTKEINTSLAGSAVRKNVDASSSLNVVVETNKQKRVCDVALRAGNLTSSVKAFLHVLDDLLLISDDHTGDDSDDDEVCVCSPRRNNSFLFAISLNCWRECSRCVNSARTRKR